MKKLKIKVFFVIFSLLTFFTLIVFIGGSVKDYVERKKSITDIKIIFKLITKLFHCNNFVIILLL